jgi:hypothetical protein
LGEKCGLAIIFQLEQCRPSFDLRLYKTRWSDFDKAVGSQRFSEGGEEPRSETEYARGSLSSEYKMPEIGKD